MKLPASFVFAILGLLCMTISSCTFKGVIRSKNITYLEADTSSKTDKQELNIFAPRKPSNPKDVFIFIHGGSWNAGRKSLYSFLGNRMARKDIVTVIVDYPLSPAANYNDMAKAVANAVRWVKENISQYGGNPKKIFISGHSAGGHLAALVALNNQYFDTLEMNNPIKGAILIDAAGLDMYGYLQEEKFPENHSYFKTFTKNPNTWKEATPLYHLHRDMPPMLIYLGEKSFPSILKSHEKFINALKEYTPNPNYHILKGKKHVPMITQFFKRKNSRYKEIIEFMKSP